MKIKINSEKNGVLLIPESSIDCYRLGFINARVASISVTMANSVEKVEKLESIEISLKELVMVLSKSGE